METNNKRLVERRRTEKETFPSCDQVTLFLWPNSSSLLVRKCSCKTGETTCLRKKVWTRKGSHQGQCRGGVFLTMWTIFSIFGTCSAICWWLSSPSSSAAVQILFWYLSTFLHCIICLSHYYYRAIDRKELFLCFQTQKRYPVIPTCVILMSIYIENNSLKGNKVEGMQIWFSSECGIHSWDMLWDPQSLNWWI